eukprot:scaffold827_cov369-Prasinococcus_capsulatus_cf.AAC.8
MLSVAAVEDVTLRFCLVVGKERALELGVVGTVVLALEECALRLRRVICADFVVLIERALAASRFLAATCRMDHHRPDGPPYRAHLGEHINPNDG